MLAIRHDDSTPQLRIRAVSDRPVRASIGARRNPDSTRAILEAAEAILRQDGLAGLSMDAIARLAQCGKPTLYRWWPDKGSLLADLHERALTGFEPIDPALDPDERLERLSRQWAEAWQTTLAGVALCGMVAEAQQSDAARAVLADRGLAPYRNALEQVLGAATDLESILRQMLYPLLGELMLSGVTTPGAPRRKPVIREAKSHGHPEPVVEVSPSSSLRDRGDWVD